MALKNAGLQKALSHAQPQFQKKRQRAVDKLPEFEALRDVAIQIKNHAIAHLDYYLEIYAANVERTGGAVHWRSSERTAHVGCMC